MSGTSMAAPAVSGVAALLLQANPDATVEELKNVLKETATPLTNKTYTEVPNNGFGHGLVDALAAVNAIAEQPEEPEVPEQPEEPAKEIERLFGHSRYDTAIEVSQKGWADDSVDKVIVARGDDFSDALAGVPLAYAWDTPILLTRSDRMLDSTLAEIERLGAEDVYVLGGPIAVSEKAEKTLENAGYTVSRIQGQSRFDTAVEIANELTDGKSEEVVIANSHKFPDALTIGSFAAQAGVPILLTKDSSIPEATANALTDLGVTDSLVVGGPLVVSEEVEAQLPNAERLDGRDRYGTNIAILENLGEDVDSLYVATGTDYADALTGAVLAAKEGKGLVLVRNIVPENINTYLSGKELEDLTIFGGPVAISDAVKEALEAILNQ
ncbi:S8 family serine peptidase [Oceanobacillus sp. 143]|nr:S8 family serine peptidase [Oceanobacillus sp. 143]